MATWNQTYLLFGSGLFLSVMVAILPIVTLLLLVGVLRKPSWVAGLCGLAVALIIAVGAYHMPPAMAVSAAANGAAFGLFPISWIVFWAIAFFRVSVDTGQFEVIKDSIGRLTTDKRLQALLIAFAFGAFIEGAAGFGTPVAIAATMLIGLGFSAFEASAVCLLANTTPVAFGSIGIPVITLAGTTGLALNRLSADVGLVCTPLAFIMPSYLLFASEGSGALAGIFIPTLLTSISFSAVQLFISMKIGPQLPDILASLAAIATLVCYLHFRPDSGAASHGEPLVKRERRALFAWTPYVLLVICVLLWGWTPVRTVLDSATIHLPWPLVHNRVLRLPPIVRSATPYPAVFTLNLLSASGTACMVATVISALLSRMQPREFLSLLVGVGRQLRLPTITVTSVLAMAFLMNYCGATATLGLAFAATGVLFPFFSALLGWLGVFLTGSDTSANALFGNLQVVTANRLGLDPALMAAVNSTGGVMGKMISLQTIAIAAAATGMSQTNQTRLFRFTLRHSLLLAILVGCVALLYSYVLHPPAA